MNSKTSMENLINKLHASYPELNKNKLQQLLINESGMKINTRPELDHKEKVLSKFDYEDKSYWRSNDNYLWNDDCNKVGCIKNGKVYLYDRKSKKFKKSLKDGFKD